MKCPSCSKSVPEGAQECPSCGVLFEKWKKLHEREEAARRDEKARALAALESSAESSAPMNPWLGRGIAGGFVLIWVLAFAWYMVRHPARRGHARGVPAPVAPQSSAYQPEQVREATWVEKADAKR